MKLQCHGGPLDGQHVVDAGEVFYYLELPPRWTGDVRATGDRVYAYVRRRADFGVEDVYMLRDGPR